jgi:hypothetical protein
MTVTSQHVWHGMFCANKKAKEVRKMENSGFSKKFLYMGIACTVVLFAVFGVFPGSRLGGAMGLDIAGILLGLPVTSGRLSTVLVAASMAMGVIVSGIIFITAAVTSGWLISKVLDVVKDRQRRMDENK